MGSLETKYVVPEYGLTFLEKWTTDNLLKCEITADDQLAQGFKVVFDASLAPNTGSEILFPFAIFIDFLFFRKKTADLRTTYLHDKAQIETNIGFDADSPTLNGSIVLGHQGWLLGYQYVYSTKKAALTRNNFSVGYKTGDLTLVGNL